MSNAKVAIGGVVAVIAGLIALVILGGSFYTVDQGERGVILRNGALVGVAEPGLGFKLPLVDSVVDINIQTQARLYEQVMVYSRDQQTAELNVSVNYRLPEDQVAVVYSDFGGAQGVVNRLLDRQVRAAAENVFGKFNAVTAIQERERLMLELQTAVRDAVKGPIVIESVQIENIDFSDAYEQSIEQRMLAEVEVQKVQQNAEREKVQAEIKVIQAQAEADARVAQAKAEAEAIELRGRAEAKAIQVRGEALARNPGLVELVGAERWDGKLPATMVPNAAVPFVSVK